MEDFESSTLIRPIDVYLSFRGDDDNACKFTDTLSAALKSALEIDDLNAFWDDKKLETGSSSVPPHHLQAIQESFVSIVVFSKTYASLWCLQELSRIVARMNGERLTVLPIFYDVDPSEVRKQINTYKKAFVEHEERFAEDLDQIQSWRQAMTQVANLCGWDVRCVPLSSYSKVIDEIIARVKQNLRGVTGEYAVYDNDQLKLSTMEKMGSEIALRLFCQIAFRRDYPVRGYGELINRVFKCINCHPLAVVISGSFFRQKTVAEWREEGCLGSTRKNS